MDARVSAAEGRPADARGALRPLLDGPVSRDAQLLMEQLVSDDGTWGGLRYLATRTSEGLEAWSPVAAGRVPLLQGHLDVEAGWSEVSFQGETRGSAVASLAAAQPLGASLGATAGIGLRQDFGGSPGISARGGARIGLADGLDLRLDLAHELLDATPASIDQRNTMTAATAALGWTGGEGSRTLTAAASAAALSAGSRRTGATLAGEQRLAWSHGSVRAGLLARGFGFSETLPLGFFNPERYRYGGATGGATWRWGRVLEADASAQGGWQWVNADPVQFTWSYALTATLSPRGWPVQLLAGWSQAFAGLPVTTPTDPASYRESTVRLGLRISRRDGSSLF